MEAPSARSLNEQPGALGFSLSGSREQTGSLHKYALLVLAGIVASLVWMWRNG